MATYIAGAIIGGAIGGWVSYRNGQNVWAGIGGGAVAGGITAGSFGLAGAAGLGLAGQSAVGLIGGLGGGVLGQTTSMVIDPKWKFDPNEVAYSTFTGGLTPSAGLAFRYGIGKIGSQIFNLRRACAWTPKPILIGQGMRQRVLPAAKELGAETYKAWQPSDTLKKLTPFIKWEDREFWDKDLPAALSLAHNRMWITGKMLSGTPIYNIGPNVGSKPSIYYGMEQKMTEYYNPVNFFFRPSVK